MRIGFDARWYNDSGVGTYVAGLLHGMAELAREYEIVVYEDPRSRVPGLERHPFRRVPFGSPKYSLREQIEFVRRCREDRLDLLHSPFYAIPYAAPCAVIATLHDVIPFLFNIYSMPKQWTVKMGYRACAMRAHHLITVSQTTSDDVQRILRVPGRKISVVHNAVSQQHFHAERDENEASYLRQKYGVGSRFVLISSPRNWRTKNLQTALRALSIARSRMGEQVQVVAYGSGQGIDESGNSIEWKRDLIRLGFVPPDELGMLFRNAQAFLLASLYEGFGLPLLESMCCGCPVVTSNGGALAEVAGTGAQVFDPMDAEGMASALVELLRSPEKREHWRAQALHRAGQFSWRKAAEQTISVYRQVCEARKETAGEACLQP
jgi:glycosyltransferase involved in cell wall biosynthesis